MTRVTIHQPNYLPYLGILDKIDRADVFVLLDTAQYVRDQFMNRNQIRTRQGSAWLTIPIPVSDCYLKRICDVPLPADGRWREKHWKSIQTHYGGSRHFEEYAPPLCELYAREWPGLSRMSEAILAWLLDAFGIRSRILRASEMDLGPELRASDLLVDIAKRVGAERYLSGASGRKYLEAEKFVRAGVALEFQDYHHPTYRQRFEGFVKNLAAIDLLFNEGPDSLRVLRSGR
ncbi:MAG: WbqC family protein [Planctomycetes bacterium]|nr:WbqC family protein [Planctomycetota bacterium]